MSEIFQILVYFLMQKAGKKPGPAAGRGVKGRYTTLGALELPVT